MNTTDGRTPVPDEPAPQPAESTEHQLASARAHVDELLRARDIKTVIYVDDGNPGPDEPVIDVETVIAALQAGQLTVELLASLDSTAAIAHRPRGELTTTEALTRSLQAQADEFTDDELAALTDAARVRARSGDVAGRSKSVTEPAAESAAAESAAAESAATESAATDLAALAELRALIPDDDTIYEPITLNEWNHRKGEVLAATEPTLVLFDRDFSRERQPDDAGEALVVEAIQADNENIYVGMLTHRAGSDQAERELVTAIAQRGGRDLVEIVVIAKQTVINNPLVFPVKLKAVLLARPLRTLRDRVAAEFERAAAAGLDQVKQLDAYTVCELVAAAEHEGAHGGHNVLRVAATTENVAAQRGLWTDQEIADALHEIRHIQGAGEPRNPLRAADIDHLRRQDRYEDGELLAELHLPLEPGDIFERVDPGVLLRGRTASPGKRYILLMQACDIMVRPNGDRLGEPATLTLARLKTVNDRNVRAFDHRLEWYDEAAEGQVWCVQVWDRIQLPVRALEACVYTSDGSGVITVGQEAPTGLTPGWAKRFAKMQEWASTQLATYQELVDAETPEPLKQLLTQALAGNSKQLVDILAELDTQHQRITFGLRRIGRVRDADARVMLANAGNYTARPDRDGNLFPDEPA